MFHKGMNEHYEQVHALRTCKTDSCKMFMRGRILWLATVQK